MRRSTALAVVVVVAAAAIAMGCRGAETHREGSRRVAVRAATQPAHPRQYDSGDRRAPDRVEVFMTEPRGEGGASPLTSLVGWNCKVQFRRDALGLAAVAPIPPTGTGPGGRAVHLSGTVRSVAGGWLVLEREANTYWIPQASILLIEVPGAPVTSPAVERP